jgi:hypothetical protein
VLPGNLAAGIAQYAELHGRLLNMFFI